MGTPSPTRWSWANIFVFYIHLSVIRAMQPSTYATFGIVMILWKQFMSCRTAVLRVNRQNFDSTVNLTNDYDTVLNFEGTSWFLPFTMPGAENLPKQHCHFDSLHGSLQDQMNFKDRSQIPLPELLIYQKWLIRPGQSTQALGDQWGVLEPWPQ